MEKRTINEIYDLIIQKIESANNDLHHEYTKSYSSQKKISSLTGEIMAYTDIKILLEQSEVLNK